MWGPCSVVSPTGFRYFVTVFYDYSRTTWLYLMKNYSELFSYFHTFCAQIHTRFHVSVQNLRSDNAKEYMSEQFQSFILQNGVAKRKNRHLLETARTLLFQMHVPKHLWTDAVSTACFSINQMPFSVLD